MAEVQNPYHGKVTREGYNDGYGHWIPGGLEARSPAAGEIPSIDFSAMLGATTEAKAAVAAELRRACTEVGFFYLTHHGIPQAVIDRAFEQGRRFFALPLEEKMQIAQSKFGGYPGFTPMKEQLNDPKARPMQEGFNMNLELPVECLPDPAAMGFHAPNLWPRHPDGFRMDIEAYFFALERLKHRLLAGFALALDLPESFFEPELTAPDSHMRINHYAAQPTISEGSSIGGRAHTDFQCCTILAQEDGLAALQIVAKDGGWLFVPPVRGSFVINIGDQMARWTNDRFLSTRHRVINTNQRDRMSIAMFISTNWDTDVAALPNAMEPGEKPLYPPIKAGPYVLDRLQNAYPGQIKSKESA
jgi:isopenicillin N synthase-like dioxygenase